MKNALIAVIILLVGLGIYFLIRPSSTNNGSLATNTGSVTKPSPANATFLFDDGPVTLSSGRAEVSISPQSAFTEEIMVLDEFAYGDVNGDEKNDTALFIARAGAGSGTFIYAAVFVSGPINYKGTNTVFLGDRISPQSISIYNGVITFKYLDRNPDEPFAAEPTIETTKQLIYQNGELKER